MVCKRCRWIIVVDDRLASAGMRAKMVVEMGMMLGRLAGSVPSRMNFARGPCWICRGYMDAEVVGNMAHVVKELSTKKPESGGGSSELTIEGEGVTKVQGEVVSTHRRLTDIIGISSQRGTTTDKCNVHAEMN